jgi:hypothetical protein
MNARGLLGLACVLLTVACTSSDSRFRLTARFKNMNQAEFYIYDQRHGHKDTIHVQDGRFEYERTMTDSATLMLMFPNYSEMPLFAHPGVALTMKGDASHLKETTVSGDDTNEEMTEFRLAVADMTPPEQLRIATNYIEDHPASPIVLYLLQHYLLLSMQPDYQQAYKLCQVICKEQPENLQAALLLKQIEPLKNAADKGRLPKFSARDTKGRPVDASLLKGEAGVVLAWASWNNESQNMVRMLRRLEREAKGRLSVITVQLDASQREGKWLFERDTISWPNVCDGRFWQTPMLSQLGIGIIGGNVVVDKNKSIVARNLDHNALKDQLQKMLNLRKD